MHNRIFVKINKLALLVYSYLINLPKKINSWKSKIDVLFIPQIGGEGGAKYYFFRAVEFYAANKFNVVILLDNAIVNKEMETFLQKNKIQYTTYNIDKDIVNNSQQYIFKNKFSRIVYKNAKRYNPKMIVAAITDLNSAFSLFLLPFRLIFICLTNPVFAKINDETKYYLSRFINKEVQLICGSEYSKQLIAKEWLNSTNHKNIKSFQNCILDTSDGKRVYDKHNEKSELVVLTVATFENWKEPDLWLDIAQKVLHENKNVSFRWVGSGSMMEQYKTRLSEIGKNQINIAGYVDDVDSEFWNADICLHTAKNDMTSYSVMQAMSYGLPIVCHNQQSMAEMIENEKEGFSLDISDTNMATQKISLLLKDNALRKKMGVAARKKFEEKFLIDNWNENMYKMHTNLS